jgi:hypothetical protein
VFVKGKTHTRQQASTELGGRLQDCLSHKDGRVVAIYMKSDMNPEAPFVLLVRKSHDRERYSECLRHEQNDDAIPIFIKKGSEAWEFQGHFKVAEHSKDVPNNRIHMVIHFKRTKAGRG